MQDLAEYVDDLPNLCGSEQLIEAAIRAGRDQPVFLGQTPVDIADIDSAFAVALHMHQPLLPAGGLAASRGSCSSTPALCCTGCAALAWTTWSTPCGP